MKGCSARKRRVPPNARRPCGGLSVGLAVPALKALRPLVLTGKALDATEKATKVVDAVNSGAQFTNDAGGLDWLKDLEKED